MSEDIPDSAWWRPRPYIKELATSRELPSFAVALCALATRSGPFLRGGSARPTRAIDEANVVLPACSSSAAAATRRFRAIAACAGPQDRSTVCWGRQSGSARIAAGMFNGDAGLCSRRSRIGEPIDSPASLGTATFLTCKVRIGENA
jgi:hypothetical protein